MADQSRRGVPEVPEAQEGGVVTTAEKCEAIMQKMLDLANDGMPVSIEADMGEHSMTVIVDKMHTHVEARTWPQFVDALHAQLCEGTGLSWE